MQKVIVALVLQLSKAMIVVVVAAEVIENQLAIAVVVATEVLAQVATNLSNKKHFLDYTFNKIL
jgi:hypothetical protein